LSSSINPVPAVVIVIYHLQLREQKKIRACVENLIPVSHSVASRDIARTSLWRGGTKFAVKSDFVFKLNDFDSVRFQVLTAASMKFRVFWDVVPCSHVYKLTRRFRGAMRSSPC
jgi:hypothetical protein